MDKINLTVTGIETVYFYKSPDWERKQYEKRNINGLIFLTNGNVKYTYGDISLYAQKGDILKFSGNIPYSGVRLDDSSVDCYVIDFTTTSYDDYESFPLPTVIRSKNYNLYLDKFNKILSIWEKKFITSEMQCISLLYDLLCELMMSQLPSNTRLSENILNYINENFCSTALTVNAILQKFYISESQLRRNIKQITGLSPNNYINTLRIEKAKKMLLHENKTIEEISAACGFSSQFYFSKKFSKYTGLPPSAYKNKNKSV